MEFINIFQNIQLNIKQKETSLTQKDVLDKNDESINIISYNYIIACGNI